MVKDNYYGQIKYQNQQKSRADVLCLYNSTN